MYLTPVLLRLLPITVHCQGTVWALAHVACLSSSLPIRRASPHRRTSSGATSAHSTPRKGKAAGAALAEQSPAAASISPEAELRALADKAAEALAKGAAAGQDYGNVSYKAASWLAAARLAPACRRIHHMPHLTRQLSSCCSAALTVPAPGPGL
jgi:hypothetical protein